MISRSEIGVDIALAYLLNRQLREGALLQRRPIEVEPDFGPRQDVRDHGLVHLFCPGDWSRPSLLGR